MFDTTQVKCPTVNSTTNNSLAINAVSGTICKNHPNSVFVWFQRGSALEKELMCGTPVFRFDTRQTYHRGDGPLYSGYRTYDHEKEPVVVLQAMLTGEDRVIAEIVRASDFFDGGDA